MKLLVVCHGARHEVLAAGSMTGLELKAKVPGGAADGVLTLGVGPAAVVLLDELPLADQGLADRDRLALTTAASPTPLGRVLEALSASAAELELLAGSPLSLHPELFTRVLEKIDGVGFDGCALAPAALDRPAWQRRGAPIRSDHRHSPRISGLARWSGTNAARGGRRLCSGRRALPLPPPSCSGRDCGCNSRQEPRTKPHAASF